jgi:NAD(P)-dependent dehydrogenase (short-subunit alcohol dehydrogenase family)
MNTRNNEKKLIAVVGATGKQGGAVVRALQASGQFNVRALSRDPGKRRELADEVVEADLNRPETLKAAFEGAHGVFLVTNFFQEKGADEFTQATAAVRAAKDTGVKHFIWSTLPTWKQSAVASSTFLTSPARPRLIQSLRVVALAIGTFSSVLSESANSQARPGPKESLTIQMLLLVSS